MKRAQAQQRAADGRRRCANEICVTPPAALFAVESEYVRAADSFRFFFVAARSYDGAPSQKFLLLLIFDDQIFLLKTTLFSIVMRKSRCLFRECEHRNCEKKAKARFCSSGDRRTATDGGYALIIQTLPRARAWSSSSFFCWRRERRRHSARAADGGKQIDAIEQRRRQKCRKPRRCDIEMRRARARSLARSLLHTSADASLRARSEDSFVVILVLNSARVRAPSAANRYFGHRESQARVF